MNISIIGFIIFVAFLFIWVGVEAYKERERKKQIRELLDSFLGLNNKGDLK